MQLNEKYLITGGAGFIGSNFIKQILNDDIEITVLDNFSSGKKEVVNEFQDNKNIEFIKTDILTDHIDDYFLPVFIDN